MPGDLLDYVLLVVCLSFAYGGFRQGFVVGVLSFVGIFGGGLVGTRVAVPIVHAVDGWVSAPVAGMVVVFVAAAIGQALAVTLGMMLRSRLRWQPARLVDNAGGAVLSVLAVLLVVWVLATSVAHSSLTGLSRQVRNSAIIRTVDEAVPGSVQSALDQFRNLLDTSGFPAIVGPLTNEPAAAVPAPDPAVLGSAAVQVARGSTVKVTGIARSCSRRIEGSGFVYAPQRVMTNAHVVAGVAAPSVQVDGKQLRATVVLYDPDRDIAVLAVPGLQAPSLAFAGTAAHGDGAVVAGYPEDGPFRAVAARIRGRQDIRGPNIYQNKTVTRDVYAIRATVLPGNSGGPLLASDGRVFGVVFAASTDTADTGYVLTAAEVAGDAAAGRTAQARVGTGSCD